MASIAKKFVGGLAIFYLSTSLAATQTDATPSANTDDKTDIKTRLKRDKPLISIPENGRSNNIPFFENRFRIDAEVDEATFLFFRRRGSPAIILVKPDGSKLKVNDHPKDEVTWHDDVTFDMVKVKKPMPGPWQALGDILPKSEIMVVSDVSLDVEPLPKTLLSGETLKITGKLINGSDKIKAPEFRDVVTLDVSFASTNNAIYENFAADTVAVTQFKDDGQNLDEYAGDGVFTGEFKLDIAPGEWTPKYTVTLPMVTREQKQDNVILRPNPVSLAAEPTKVVGEFHKITFKILPDDVNVSSLVFQGKITYPNLETELFSILEPSESDRVKTFENKEAGVHRIKVEAFGETLDGREFSLAVPEFVFNVELPERDVFEDAIDETVEANSNEANDFSVDDIAPVEVKPPEPVDNSSTWLFIGLANVVIILIGGIAIWLVARKKK